MRIPNIMQSHSDLEKIWHQLNLY